MRNSLKWRKILHIVFKDLTPEEELKMETLDDFRANLERPDGFGYFCTNTKRSNVEVDMQYPHKRPSWAKHIIWKNYE